MGPHDAVSVCVIRCFKYARSMQGAWISHVLSEFCVNSCFKHGYRFVLSGFVLSGALNIQSQCKGYGYRFVLSEFRVNRSFKHGYRFVLSGFVLTDFYVKGTLAKYNIIPDFFTKIVQIFKP